MQFRKSESFIHSNGTLLLSYTLHLRYAFITSIFRKPTYHINKSVGLTSNILLGGASLPHMTTSRTK